MMIARLHTASTSSKQMRRDNDRLVRPHRRNDGWHFVFLVRIEPVGRLVEDQNVGIVQQGLRDTNTALIAFRQGFDRLMHDLADPDHLDDAADAPRCFVAREASNVSDEVGKSAGVMSG